MNWFQHYVNAGMSVLPIKTDGSKSPAVGSWSKYQSQIATPSECDEWNARGYGIGIIGGKVSGGLEVIDIDDPSLARPFCEALKESAPMLIHRLAFVATPRRDPETGKSGVHVYYRTTNPQGNTKLAMSEPLPQFDGEGNQLTNPVNDDVVMRPETLIETRGEGGYVLTVGCPPECHPTGNQYEHKLGCEIAQLEPISDEDRQSVMQVAKSFDRSVVSSHGASEHERDAESPGNKYARQTSWEEILVPHGWTMAGVASGVQRWCRPGKNIGWSATAGLVSQHGAELLCVFSTSAHPFPGPTGGASCSTHSKFDAFAKLNFGGDHKAAAKHLAAEGYGAAAKPTEKPKKPIVFETWDHVTREYLSTVKEGANTTLSTGLGVLDDMIGGLAFGELVIIGGRPSHGKTLLALQFADYLATEQHSALLISEEMSKPMLSKRLLHMATDLEEEYWPSQFETVQQHYNEHMAARSPVYIAPQCGTIDRAVEVIGQAAEEFDLRIVVVDYAQLLRGKGNTRYEQVTDVSQRLREATSKHNLLTLMLCQLNRGSERNDSRPRSIDLRDSGQLEQDADVVLLVDWPKRRGSNEGEWDDYYIYAEKNRNRETHSNQAVCTIVPRRQRIEEKSNEWQPANWEQP